MNHYKNLIREFVAKKKHKKTASLTKGGFDFYSEITFPFLS